jgi:hypothetical protein
MILYKNIIQNEFFSFFSFFLAGFRLNKPLSHGKGIFYVGFRHIPHRLLTKNPSLLHKRNKPLNDIKLRCEGGGFHPSHSFYLTSYKLQVAGTSLCCPFRAPIGLFRLYPGRCPGLGYIGLSARKTSGFPRQIKTKRAGTDKYLILTGAFDYVDLCIKIP